MVGRQGSHSLPLGRHSRHDLETARGRQVLFLRYAFLLSLTPGKEDHGEQQKERRSPGKRFDNDWAPAELLALGLDVGAGARKVFLNQGGQALVDESGHSFLLG